MRTQAAPGDRPNDDFVVATEVAAGATGAFGKPGAVMSLSHVRNVVPLLRAKISSLPAAMAMWPSLVAKAAKGAIEGWREPSRPGTSPVAT